MIPSFLSVPLRLLACWLCVVACFPVFVWTVALRRVRGHFLPCSGDRSPLLSAGVHQAVKVVIPVVDALPVISGYLFSLNFFIQIGDYPVQLCVARALFSRPYL